MSSTSSSTKSCNQCSREYAWVRGSMGERRGCCSIECKKLADRERSQRRYQGGYYPPSRPTPKRHVGPTPCLHCGEHTTRPQYCSAKCSQGARDIRIGIRAAVFTASCRECGVSFTASHSRRVCCSTECRRRAANRKSSAIRRARLANLPRDYIDPLEVCERDKWRCHICGCPTPKALRGTIDSSAPEMDHIVPLALGGHHVLSNVACACRACNLAKGGGRAKRL